MTNSIHRETTLAPQRPGLHQVLALFSRLVRPEPEDDHPAQATRRQCEAALDIPDDLAQMTRPGDFVLIDPETVAGLDVFVCGSYELADWTNLRTLMVLSRSATRCSAYDEIPFKRCAIRKPAS